MSAKKLRGNLLLLFTATIWGTAFVAQSLGMSYIGPFTFNAIRSIVGGIVLIPCIFLCDQLTGRHPAEDPAVRRKAQKTLWTGGIACGIVLGIASSIQQLGISYTTAGKAGFITALYIVLVPILGLLFRRHVSWSVWVGVALAVGGLYLLCINEEFQIGTGDLYVLICAVSFAIHILIVEHFSPKVDGVRMSCIQFFVAGILSAIPMFLFETPSIPDITAGILPILYAGVLSSGVAYTLQIIGQKDVSATTAALIMSLESVIAVLSSWLILKEAFTVRELIGCVLMFAATILAQLPDKRTPQVPSKVS